MSDNLNFLRGGGSKPLRGKAAAGRSLGSGERRGCAAEHRGLRGRGGLICAVV